MKHAAAFLAGALSLLALAGCPQKTEEQPEASEGGGTTELTVYSGRSKALVDHLVEQYEAENEGVEVNVRYGKDAALLAALQEEGEQSSADVFWANTTGALGAAAEEGLLAELPDALRERPARFTASSGRWVPVTARFRVLAYHTDEVTAEDLPASVLDLPRSEAFEGRIGWTPTYSSFQDFVTALRVIHGPEETTAWLEGVKALEPKSYRSNTPMIQALAAGEIDVALTNHYYVQRLKHGGAEGEYEGHEEEEGEEEEEHEEEADPSAPVAVHHFEAGDAGNLALVTGAGMLQQGAHPQAAEAFLQYLLSAEAQSYAAESVHEYPVVGDVELPERLLPASEALELSPELDFEAMRQLEETLALLRDSGIL